MGSEYDGIPQHDVVVSGDSADARGGILLETLEVPHQTASGRRRHLSTCRLLGYVLA